MIFFDEDSDARFYRTEAGTIIAEDLDKLVDLLADTGTGVFVVGVNAKLTNYPSKAWQSYLDGFDITKGLEQPYMMGFKDKWTYRRAAGIQVLANQGIDSNKYLLRRSREKGMKGYITVRMNDIHYSEYESHPAHSRFWMEHKEMRSSNHPYENGLDYSFEEVRSYYMKLIEELLERYDIDGIVIDWMRGALYFKEDEAYDKRHIITEMMTRICACVRKKEKKSDRQIELCARVPVTIQNALRRGFDAVEWAKRGLLDRLIISPCFFASYEITANEWKESIDKEGFLVTADIENAISSSPCPQPAPLITVEQMRGAAWAALSRGSDDIYIFNFMDRRGDPANRAMFEDCGSIEMLRGKNRTFKITWNDIDVPNRERDKMIRVPGYKEKWFAERMSEGTYPFALPAVIAPAMAKSFKLYTGPVPESGPVCYVKINELNSERIVKVNGHQCSIEGDTALLDKEIMTEENTFVEIINSGKQDITITDLELSVTFP